MVSIVPPAYSRLKCIGASGTNDSISVTAAGICVDKPFEDHSWDDFMKQSLVNVSARYLEEKLSLKQS